MEGEPKNVRELLDQEIEELKHKIWLVSVEMDKLRDKIFDENSANGYRELETQRHEAEEKWITATVQRLNS